MGILSNVAGSLTGSIDKALLCVRKPNLSAGGNGAAGALAGLASASNVDLQAQLIAARGTRKNIVSSFASVSTVTAAQGYHVLQVKYNPSKITVYASGGMFMEAGAGGVGANSLAQVTQPTQTFMQVELLFDDENHPDAFMWEKFTNLTAGALVSDAAGAAKTAMGKGYSVQAQVEGLIALLSQSETRQVVFYWSDLCYAGEVTAVNAKYTMFNPQGNPIRGTVALTILDSDATSNSGGGYWDKAFEDLFEEDTSAAGKFMNGFHKAAGSTGNIINWR